MKKLKVILGLLVLSFCLQSLYSQAATSQEETDDLQIFQQWATDLSQPSLNSKIGQPSLNPSSLNESQNSIESNQNSTEQTLDSMSVEELFTKCEETLTQQEAIIKRLTLTSENLEKDLINLTIEYNNLKNSLAQMKEALISNKDDTSFMIRELGKLLDEIVALKEKTAYLEKRMKNAYIYGNVVTTIPGLLVMSKGFADLAMSGADPVKVDMAWKWIAAGAITELGMHVVYQGGHWIFKIW